jgi:wyosine [tRNA(Phe)-imidazoG37] synthetase (radical SAM superfamily)
MRLSTRDHSRASSGWTYVYSVISRRAGGISIGINLNPNRACNWRCVYCQVPGLVRGAGPRIDLEQLERELEQELLRVRDPRWLAEHGAAGQPLVDLAFSGDGEPTSSPDFAAAVERVAALRRRAGLAGHVGWVLITNGSLCDRPGVWRALARMGEQGGQAWFKFDGASQAVLRRMNSTRTSVLRVRERLMACARALPTWIQTMFLDFEGPSLDGPERARYCEFLSEVLGQGTRLEGVLLYGLARESHQPEAPLLAALPAEELERFAREIRARTGLTVRVRP